MPRSEYDWEAFLGRVPGTIDSAAVQRKLQGKTIVITGAGGFIGSALVRALVAYAPAHLVLLDIAEHGLHDLESAFTSAQASVPSYTLVVSDVCDALMLARLFSRHRPQIVFHAAALKHVGLMEANPVAAARTNILGTQAVLMAADAAGCDHFILISTDKAANPISLMGATKRIAELLVLASRGHFQAQAVRLGNVLGSTGSVVPTLERQIAACGPLTITDPACTRYFLSAEEVVRHLLRALLVQERASILIPDPGTAHRVVDLARFLAERAGRDLAALGIVHTGLRPGEKLNEELLADDENAADASVGGRQVLAEENSQRRLHASISRVDHAVCSSDAQALLLAITEMLPRYHPSPALRRYAAALTAGYPA